jgi:hypothetical protein
MKMTDGRDSAVAPDRSQHLITGLSVDYSVAIISMPLPD